MMTNRHHVAVTWLLDTRTKPGAPSPGTSSPMNASNCWLPVELSLTVAEQVIPLPQTASSAPVVSS